MASIPEQIAERVLEALKPVVLDAVRSALIADDSTPAAPTAPRRRGRSAGTRASARRARGGRDSYILGATRGRIPGWLAGSTGAAKSADLMKRWASGTEFKKGEPLPTSKTPGQPKAAKSAPRAVSGRRAAAGTAQPEEKPAPGAKAPIVRKAAKAEAMPA